MALIQTLAGTATLGGALLAPEGDDPPKNDGSFKQSENQALSSPERPCGVSIPRS